MNVTKWMKTHTQDLSGKTVAITGSTGGLGTKLCAYLASLNANLLLLNRSEKKTLAQQQAILSEYPNTRMEFVQMDQGDFENVKSVCEQLKNKEIDYLIINAGVYNVPLVTTDTGYNNIFQINFLSPYYLVKTLLPHLQERKSKVVVVGSLAHHFSKLDATDADFSHHKGANKIYGNSKRFLLFSMFELFKNQTDVKLTIAHPGVTLTNMTNHYPKAINWFIKGGIKIVFPSPQKAALSVIDGLFTDCGYCEWIGPSVFGIWGKPKKRKLRSCKSDERKQIFKIAESIFEKLQNTAE